MRNSVTLKVLVLSCLSYATWAVTSSIVANGHSATTMPRDGKVLSDKIPTVALATSRSPKLHTSFLLKQRSFTVQGDKVQITASVDLKSRGRGSVYLWRLQAVNLDNDAAVLDMPYTKQLFEIHPSGVMEPTFEDSIQLPAGKYRVILTLSSIPKGYDLTELNDTEKAQAASLITVSDIVTINE